MTRTLIWLVIAVGPAWAEPVVVLGDPSHQLVLDDRLFQTRTNAELRLGTVQKHANNPLLVADQPWENATNNLYPNVQWDPDEKRYRLWYKCVVHDATAIAQMQNPLKIHEQGWYLLHAQSNDGSTWSKPLAPTFPFAGKPTNAVAQDTPNVGVFRDAHERDPAMRFKMIFDTGLGELKVRFSKDGRAWSPPIVAKGFGARHGDTHSNAFWDERLQRYVLFTKHYLGERLVARFESTDFVHWTDTGLALASLPHEGKNTQTYCLTAFPYGNVWLGYVMLYHVGSNRHVSCELAWSADSITWQRVQPGQALIPFGAKGQGDSACIYAQAGPALVERDRVAIYYGGSDTPHVGWKRHCLLNLATVRRDGFAGYAPLKEEQPAELTTEPLRITGKELLVRLDAKAGGQVRVMVLDDATLNGAWSDPLTHDGPATWRGKEISTLQGRVVRLKFRVKKATLYSFHGAEQLPRVHCTTTLRHFSQATTVGFQVEPVAGRPTTSVLRYTTDGRKPTLDDRIYTQPFRIETATRLRLCAFVDAVPGPELDVRFVQRHDATTTTPPVGATRVQFAETFRANPQHWKGVDSATWVQPENAGAGGHLRVQRTAPQVPFAQLLMQAAATPKGMHELRGDWRTIFGSPALRITWQMRSPAKGGSARIELIAADRGGWYRELPGVAEDWQTFTTSVRFDWTDDEAKAAGWQRTTAAFAWRDTLRHISKVVFGPSVQGQPTQFDLRDVRLEAAWESEPRRK